MRHLIKNKKNAHIMVKITDLPLHKWMEIRNSTPPVI